MSHPDEDRPATSHGDGRSLSPAEGPVPSSSETKQERRAGRKKKERERMPQHGKGLAQIYKDAVEKRAGKKEPGH